MAHVASEKKMSISLALTDSAILSSAVHSMFVTTALIRSTIAFTVGLLTA